jgi:hypothetical protein
MVSVVTADDSKLLLTCCKHSCCIIKQACCKIAENELAQLSIILLIEQTTKADVESFLEDLTRWVKNYTASDNMKARSR